MPALYTFTNYRPDSPQLQGAPRAIPAGPILDSGANYLYSDSSGYQLIDVVNNFQWTTTPKTGRQEVPAIYLKEKRLKTNSMIAQAIYYGLALGNITAGTLAGFQNLPPELRRLVQTAVGAYAGLRIGNLAGNLTQNLGNFIGNFFGSAGITGQNIGSIIQNAGGITNALAPAAGTVAGGVLGYNISSDSITAGLNSLVSNLTQLNRYIPSRFNIDSLGSDILGPYEGLYITEDTKFLYNFPYFSNSQNNISNQFGESDEVFTRTDPLGINNLAQSLRYAANFASGVVNFDAPGIYIEKPKFYQFEREGEIIDFTFPLINTGWSDFNDVMANWQLLFLLTYQNRPNRRSRDLIDPAVIYELTIPGVRFYPFCFIEQMSIDFVGSRRRMNIQVPYGSGLTTINTIIPDAYIVKITLRTLTSETQNFLYSTLQERQNIVTVTNSSSFLDIARDEFLRSYNQVNALSQLNSRVPSTQSGAQAFGQGVATGLNGLRRATGL